ncbi:Beta-fructofuranosidase protein [Vigna angularis]|uniref:Beta-fructofuranosidase protein n=1 Tax=Phaseolus angularis TaxID=3914 RepID=A0A8T0JNV2_PHAAN|nr:Beta-fructofuranosidase protein [Vigna angularis]
MTMPTMCLLILFSVIYGSVATHHFSRNLQTLSSDSNDQPYRTAYHFQPPKNWINDPNGPMRYGGLYHLFYQYNPKGAVWGNIVWGHSVSKDLVNWTTLDPAIFPSQPSDINGCWSGSTTLLPGNKPTILYTGINSMNKQVQNLAKPKNLSDPFLREWVKFPQNPVMAPTSDNNIVPDSFRDPTTAWLGQDGHWRVLVGSRRRTRGMALLYRSKDFVNWVQAKHPFYSTKDSGMWECPDFFPVLKNGQLGVETSVNGDDVRHVLKASLKGHDDYIIGNYNTSKDVFVPDKGFDEFVLRFDYGKYYASKSFFDDGKKRRVLLGWVDESSSEADDIKKGWSSLNKDNDLTTYGAFVDVEPLHEQLSLRTLTDHSVVESFGGEGRACITARVYPTLAINDKAQLYAFNNGTADVNITRLNAWSMKKAQIN